MMLRRADLKNLAEMRLREAQVLIVHELFSGAYYLAGYAVELGLKAILAGKFVADAIPDRTLVNRIHTHDLKELVSQAGLQLDLNARRAVDDRFAANWEVVRNWREDSRYVIVSSEGSRNLVEAVSHQTSGVFPWIRTHW